MQRVELPEHLVRTAREFADGTRTPAEPRDAATVVLMRQGAGAPEIYLLRRQTSMDFAAGMAVFPGGGVDPRDFDAEIGWVGPSPVDWARRLGADEAHARALVCAAVRETFEESGVLLAGASADSVVSDTTGAEWEADRRSLEARELAFSELLARRGLMLRSDLLGVWSGWLTPVFEPKRYRTWFFVAELPSGQRTRDVSTESSSVSWLDARTAVAEADAHRLLMLPPTHLTCLEVSRFDDPASVMTAAAGRTVEMFTPEVVEEGGRMMLSAPPWLLDLLREGTP